MAIDDAAVDLSVAGSSAIDLFVDLVVYVAIDSTVDSSSVD